MWPNGGYEKLLAASMWWIYAGGNASASFYRNVSDLIGDYEYTERSTSAGRGGGSTQVSRRTERIMDVADLDVLSVGRMIVFASGCRPALVRARPWFTDKRLRQLVAMRPDRVHHQAEEDVHVSETTEDSFVVDELAIAAAAMDVAAAEKALHSAEEKAAAADDALAERTTTSPSRKRRSMTTRATTRNCPGRSRPRTANSPRRPAHKHAQHGATKKPTTSSPPHNESSTSPSRRWTRRRAHRLPRTTKTNHRSPCSHGASLSPPRRLSSSSGWKAHSRTTSPAPSGS